ncbi:MAG: HAMP domain-containing sensor histidine kinase [Clostridia bacterium]|nr:HAMP domain-containing sensor histidine kinase [Clostridia bacterium]
MTFWRDRPARRFCFFLFAFALALLGALSALALFQAGEERAMLRRHDEAVAASLLAQGVAQDVVAVALTSEAGGGAGRALLQRQGLLDGWHPAMRGAWGARMLGVLAAWGALSAALLLGAFLFLERRERAYDLAADALERLAQGEADAGLPGEQEGAYSRLLSCAARLAAMLRSRGESEHEGRVFLRNMISDIAHQLRTPLAAMSMYQEIIAAEADCEQTVLRFSGKMADALGRMERLVESFIRLARLDAGGIVFERERCEIAELVNMAAGELTTRMQREGKTLTLEGEPELELLCDRALTAEAIGNVIKNAVDHTGRGGVIRVSWSASPLLTRITVEDDGPGIAPEDIHHIFKRFYRGPAASGARGVGLGLPLALAIAKGQGGTLGVSSAVGHGAAFTFSFPNLTKP